MKVLYFHQHFSTPEGATGIRSYQMAKRLLYRGHEVTIICGSYSGGVTGLKGIFRRGFRSGTVDGIEIIEIDAAYSNSDGFVKRTLIFAKFAILSIFFALKKEYDVVFATTTPLTAAIPGIVAKWMRRKHFVFEVRDLWPELPREMGVITNPVILWMMGALEWLAYKSANSLIALSPGIERGIRRLDVAEENVTVIPNGCDLKIFGQDDSVWRPQEISEKDFMAVFTGTHGIANGLDAAIDAAIVLKERERGDIKLLLVGQGKLKPVLIARAQKEGLSNIIFHDPIDKAKLAGLLNSADVGMQLLANIPAFYFGTSPNKFFDYIAAGLPIINNYPGWLADLIDKTKCGVVVPAESPCQFADALEYLADNREALPAMGRSARKLAETEFSREDLADKFVSWIEDSWNKTRAGKDSAKA